MGGAGPGDAEGAEVSDKTRGREFFRVFHSLSIFSNRSNRLVIWLNRAAPSSLQDQQILTGCSLSPHHLKIMPKNLKKKLGKKMKRKSAKSLSFVDFISLKAPPGRERFPLQFQDLAAARCRLGTVH